MNKDKIAALEVALKNCPSPSNDFHTTCPKCRHQFHANNGEWLLWCGGKEHAVAILEAARAHLEQLRRGDADKTSRCTVCGVTIPFTENYGHMQCTKHEPQV